MSNKPEFLRIIGDVHGHITPYRNLVRKSKYSIQLGDLGWSNNPENPLAFMNDLDPDFHKVIGGNHDYYTEDESGKLKQTPHFLGDFGVFKVPGFGDIFFVRGELSIDKKHRTENETWWRREELSQREGIDALERYAALRPSFVITHGCPSSVTEHIANTSWDIQSEWGVSLPSSTAQLLQQMWEIHQPKTWIFGHYHKDWTKTLNLTKADAWYDKNSRKEYYNCCHAVPADKNEFMRPNTTLFICLNELSHLDFALDNDK